MHEVDRPVLRGKDDDQHLYALEASKAWGRGDEVLLEGLHGEIHLSSDEAWQVVAPSATVTPSEHRLDFKGPMELQGPLGQWVIRSPGLVVRMQSGVGGDAEGSMVMDSKDFGRIESTHMRWRDAGMSITMERGVHGLAEKLAQLKAGESVLWKGRVLFWDRAACRMELSGEVRVDLRPSMASMTSDRLEFGCGGTSPSPWYASGHVDVRQGDSRMESDRAVFDPKTGRIDAEGSVALYQAGHVLKGERAWFDTVRGHGSMGGSASSGRVMQEDGVSGSSRVRAVIVPPKSERGVDGRNQTKESTGP
jgi:hypothetical protein